MGDKKVIFLIHYVLCLSYVLAEYEYIQNPAVDRFREYLQIDTSQADNLWYAVNFWQRQADELGLHFAVYVPRTKPVVVLTWPGTNQSLPSIMLNSHMDVIPADEHFWSYPPFEAHVDEEVNIYARGTQDMKGMSIQYLEAIRTLKENNIMLERTVHITLMPDDETGSRDGIKSFVHTDSFKSLNVGFALDEAIFLEDSYVVTYVDKRAWQMKFTIDGVTGPSPILLKGTAMEKALRLLNAIYQFRNDQQRIQENADPLDYGAYTSVNVDIIHAGELLSQIPNQVIVVVDMRLATSLSPHKAQSLVNGWLQYAGNETSVEFIRQENVSLPTPLDDSNSYWVAMQQAAQDMGITLQPAVFVAASTLQTLRNLGIPAIGFTPVTHTELRVHGNDDYLNIFTFLQGVNIYANILLRLGNCS